MGLSAALWVFGGRCTRRTSVLIGRRENVLGGLGVVSGSHWFVKWGSRIGTRGAVGPQGVAGYYSSDAKGIGDDSGPAFDKILIANRGEIACRVMKTAKLLGIRTVAVYSDIDDGSKHMKMADEAINIGPAPPLESYLNINKIVAAAQQTGAQAVHPGYGFLSESTEFAAECEKEGVEFVGPGSDAIHAMGDKLTSKDIALKAGVHTIPGYEGAIDDTDHAISIARDIGYPVMMKASAGGGGKGMRVAYSDKDIVEGFPLSKAEALSAFGDDRMLVERYIQDGHHIEIQIIADKLGNIIAFPERECSVQRRNQKVIEESPSCLLDEETRVLMQDQAIALSRAVGYVSAGTVEFIAAHDRSFYFLEMNTRLQVEHPITEAVTGADLVKEMLCIAAGRPISAELLDKGPHIPYKGHAIESRVYAENPFRHFLPSIGLLTHYKEPNGPMDNSTPSVRVDSGFLEGTHVSLYYDPLISKLTTYGQTRPIAIHRMEDALDEYIVEGLSHNIPFLRDAMRNERFVDGNYNTSFIPHEYPNGFNGVKLDEEERCHLAICCALIRRTRNEVKMTISGSLPSYDPLSTDDEVAVVLSGDDEAKNDIFWIRLSSKGDEKEDGSEHLVARVRSNSGSVDIDLNGIDWQPEAWLMSAELGKKKRVLQYRGAEREGYNIIFLGSKQYVIVRSKQEQPKDEGPKQLQCPMPGKLISIDVKPRQQVEAGQRLAVVEAMKMQNVLHAQREGRVKRIRSKVGDILEVNAIIMDMED